MRKNDAKNLAATCRIEPWILANQSNAVLLYQWDSRYCAFFNHMHCESTPPPEVI